MWYDLFICLIHDHGHAKLMCKLARSLEILLKGH